MTDSGIIHLSEAERHAAADGTLAPEHTTAVGQHLETCGACAADVVHIKTLMTRTREAPTSVADDGGDLWPAIRARIEQDKVASLPGRRAMGGGRRRYVWLAAASVLAAGSIAVIVVRRNATLAAPSVERVGAGTPFTAVAESTHVYEEQIKFLLNELELRRALMRPQTAASVDHELEVIDSAIAELKRAIERDPKNVALRALLAQSYKQKVDLLKRIAG
jgi:hypothetical protein